MSTRTHFGCVGLRGPIETYARRFDVVELDLLDRDPKPKPATLRRWRRDAGPNLQIALVAPAAVAAARPGPALDEALERYLEAQRLLQARILLLQTKADFTPSALNRERLVALIGRIREGLGDAKAVVRIAWEPRGVWENDDAASFARTHGIDLALDPLADPREPFFDEVLRYWRLGTVGGRTEFPPTRLRYLAEILAQGGGDGERHVLFATPHAPREIKRLRTLAEGLAGRSKPSGGAVIRPRGSLSLPETEDE
jgi:uncharacterized protein YecE (DUF72 family)